MGAAAAAANIPEAALQLQCNAPEMEALGRAASTAVAEGTLWEDARHSPHVNSTYSLDGTLDEISRCDSLGPAESAGFGS
jgi:hypothetical protein